MTPTPLPIAVLLVLITAVAATAAAAPQLKQSYTVPVVCLHGLNCSAADCADLGALLAREHPGQPFYALAIDEGGASFSNLFDQLDHVRAAVRGLVRDHPAEFADGFHFVGHSQGGLLARAVIEESDDLHVINFLSLAGVQAGQFAIPLNALSFVACFS